MPITISLLGIPELGEKQWAEKEERRKKEECKVRVNNGQINRLYQNMLSSKFLSVFCFVCFLHHLSYITCTHIAIKHDMCWYTSQGDERFGIMGCQTQRTWRHSIKPIIVILMNRQTCPVLIMNEYSQSDLQIVPHFLVLQHTMPHHQNILNFFNQNENNN